MYVSIHTYTHTQCTSRHIGVGVMSCQGSSVRGGGVWGQGPFLNGQKVQMLNSTVLTIYLVWYLIHLKTPNEKGESYRGTLGGLNNIHSY